MDPEMCLHYWRQAIANEDWDSAQEHGDNLRTWLRRGGFEPAWQAGEREVFFPPKERLR